MALPVSPGRRPADRADWAEALVGAARTSADLVARGLLPDTPEARGPIDAAAARYRMLASDYYLGLMSAEARASNDPAVRAADPIWRQAVADPAELLAAPGELTDPIGDATHSPVEGLVHRYPDRVLFFPTLLCPMYCRYCFRKVALNEAPVRLERVLPAAVAYVAARPAIREVILSGGDPLLLPDDRLLRVLDAFRAVPSVERLRIHSRVPVTLPMRIDAALARLLADRRPLYVVAHYNHPQELSPEAERAVRTLVDAGVTVLNQAVLLRGVNDDPEVLAALFGGLLRWQVRPYYLHHLDLTVGTSAFRLSLRAGLEIVRALRGRLTGLAWPTYVLDIPGGGGKVPVDSGFVRSGEAPDIWHLRGPLGGAWRYVDPAVHPAGHLGFPPGVSPLAAAEA